MREEVRIPAFLTKSSEAIQKCNKELKRVQVERTESNSGRFTMDAGLRNSDRNRYTNVIPYDRTRVKLKVASGFSDYINASHIRIDLQKYATREKHYIASQGPIAATVNHFWQMCFDEVKGQNIVIVMLSPLTEAGYQKVYPYWPQEGEDQLEIRGEEMFAARDLRMTRTKDTVHDTEGGFTVSTFALQDVGSGTSKTVHHLYYSDWADFQRPSALPPLLRLSSYANSCLGGATDPIFVHCSAGVGRSGTFIALDYLLTCSKLFTEPGPHHVDDSDDLIEATVVQMRESRMMMVERFEQLEFLYKSLYQQYLALQA